MRNGKFKLVIKPADIRKSVLELIEIFRIAAESKNIKLNVQINEHIPKKLMLDVQRVQ